MTSADRPTVLIVDDEPDLVELFSVYLQDSYDVRTATAGEDAMDLVDDDLDVVLLDRRMPTKSGDEILAEIRNAGYRFPIAMITAVSPDMDIVDMAFADYVTKPVDSEGLLSTVEVLVERREYDEKCREFFQLASKKATLETSREFDVNSQPAYHEIRDRMKELQDQLDETLTELTDQDARDAFKMVQGRFRIATEWGS